MGAYYHEFFLRGKPQLAAQMFCKNARSKIAMATPPAPAPVVEAVDNMQMLVARQQEQQQQQEIQEMQMLEQQQKLLAFDPAQMFLTGQGAVDPQAQMLFEQQLQLMQQQKQMQQFQDMQQQQQQQQDNFMLSDLQPTPLLEPGNSSNMNDNMMFDQHMAMNVNMMQQQQQQPMDMMPNNFGLNSMTFEQEFLEQQQHEARMAQLQQLMAFNFERQQNRRSKSNNYRASAA
jgi:hypothetical protein